MTHQAPDATVPSLPISKPTPQAGPELGSEVLALADALPAASHIKQKAPLSRLSLTGFECHPHRLARRDAAFLAIGGAVAGAF